MENVRVLSAAGIFISGFREQGIVCVKTSFSLAMMM